MSMATSSSIELVELKSIQNCKRNILIEKWEIKSTWQRFVCKKWKEWFSVFVFTKLCRKWPELKQTLVLSGFEVFANVWAKWTSSEPFCLNLQLYKEGGNLRTIQSPVKTWKRETFQSFWKDQTGCKVNSVSEREDPDEKLCDSILVFAQNPHIHQLDRTKRFYLMFL